jgi:hypothetical protein
MFVTYVCFALCRKRPLRRPDHSFRGVLPVVCVYVCNLQTSTMGWPVLQWAVGHRKKDKHK